MTLFDYYNQIMLKNYYVAKLKLMIYEILPLNVTSHFLIKKLSFVKR